jgi:hypothetical protein
LPREGDSAPRVVADIHELVELIELEDIYYWEERARRVNTYSLDEGATPEERTTNSLGVSLLDTGEAFGIAYRFRLVFNDGNGAEFVSDIEARYVLPERCDIAVDVQREYATRVAFMTVYPYIRASIQTMAMRLGVAAPVLGMVKQGGMTISDDLSPEEAQERMASQVSEFDA